MGEKIKNIILKIDLNEEVNKNDIDELIKDKDVYEKYKLLKELSKLLKKRISYFIHQMNLSKKIGDKDSKDKEKQKIKKIKRVQRLITEEMNLLEFPEKERNTDKPNVPVFLKMQLSNLNDIKCMQYLLDEDTKHVLEELDNELDSVEKLDLIEGLIIKFEGILKDLQSKLKEITNSLLLEVRKDEEYNYRIKTKKIKKFLSDKKYESFKIDIDYYNVSIKGVKTLLERLYTLKGIQKAAIAKTERDNIRRNSEIFEDDTNLIVDELIENCSMDEILKNKMQEVSKLFFKLVNHIKTLEECDDLEGCINFFTSVFEIMENEEVICLCNIFRRSLKNRCNELKELDYDTSLIRKKYKKFMNTFMAKKKDVFNYFKEDESNNYFYIFTPLLEDDLNYYYFKRVLEEVKYDLNKTEIKTLIEKIIDLFIVNYKYKLASQNFCYIEPKYYETLLELFIRNNLIDENLNSLIVDRLEEFKKYLCRKEEISWPNAEALKVIEDLILKLNGYTEYKTNSSNIKEKIELLMKEKMPYIINNHQRLGFSSGDKEKYSDYDYSTFVVGDYAYSKRYNDEGDLYLQIHILDTTSIVTENECLDDKILESNLSKNDINFKYEIGKKYPVQTFQFRIYQNNSVGDMKVFSNIIEIDSIYSKDDLIYYRDNNDLKALISACKRIGNFCLEDFDIDKNTEILLSEYIIDFLNGFEKEIPMMYKRDCGEIFSDLSMYNHNQVCYFLSKIDKKQAHKIFYILDEMPEDIYTNYQTEESYLSIDPFSYSGLYLIRTIKQLINNEYLFNDEDYNKEKARIIEYCKSLNKNYGYVSDKIMKQDKVKNIDKR